MTGKRACVRKTTRWPYCSFQELIDMAALNSYIIRNINNASQTSTKKKDTRKIFPKFFELY